MTTNKRGIELLQDPALNRSSGGLPGDGNSSNPVTSLRSGCGPPREQEAQMDPPSGSKAWTPRRRWPPRSKPFVRMDLPSFAHRASIGARGYELQIQIRVGTGTSMFEGHALVHKIRFLWGIVLQSVVLFQK